MRTRRLGLLSLDFSVPLYFVLSVTQRLSEEPVRLCISMLAGPPLEESEACTVLVRASVPSGPSSAEGIAKDNFTYHDGLTVRPLLCGLEHPAQL